MGAPFGRLACGAKATHARALRSPYFHYRIISRIGRKNCARKRARKNLHTTVTLQYPYQRATRPLTTRSQARAKKRPRGWRPSHPRHTVMLQYPYRNPHPYYSTPPTIAGRPLTREARPQKFAYYSTPTVPLPASDPAPTIRARKLALKRPRRWRPSHPQAYGRYTVTLQYPYRNPHPYYSTLPTIAAPHTASLLTLPPLPQKEGETTARREPRRRKVNPTRCSQRFSAVPPL